MALEDLLRRLGAALLLALSICGLHFTDMAAVSITPGLGTADGELLMSSGPLAIAVASVGMLLIMLSLSGAMMDQHLGVRSAREARRLRQMAEATFEGLLIHRGGLILDANKALGRMLGRAPEELRARNVAELVIPEERVAIARRLQIPERQTTEAHLAVADHPPVPVEMLCRDIDHDGQTASVIALRDLSDRKRVEEQIRYLAHHDSLTGLPNRFVFNDRLRQAVGLSVREQEKLAVLCLDLDRFKFVNDLLGHAAGDQLMTQIADRLRPILKPTDTVARLGGDEFAILQPFLKTVDEAGTLAQRIVDALSAPFEIDNQQVQISTSIGISIFPGDGTSPDRLLKNADLALYRAKHDGRGGFRFFEEAMDLRLQEHRLLEQDLRQAIGRGEMELHYQPFASCETGRIRGFEALMRWNHPERGAISPADFIPIAEESGLIYSLGKWALQTACTAAANWPDGLLLAVNVSPAQFRQADMPELIAATLRESGLPRSRLELEVTEGVLIDDANRALEVLTALKNQGIRISLDDFGTGYSSLSYLRRFPFDKLKIDRSIVRPRPRRGRRFKRDPRGDRRAGAKSQTGSDRRRCRDGRATPIAPLPGLRSGSGLPARPTFARDNAAGYGARPPSRGRQGLRCGRPSVMNNNKRLAEPIRAQCPERR